MHYDLESLLSSCHKCNGPGLVSLPRRLENCFSCVFQFDSKAALPVDEPQSEYNAGKGCECTHSSSV
jgi:hypothetical protein